MSDSTAVAVRERADVFPNFIMSEPEWLSHVGVEDELNRDYAAEYVSIAVRCDPSRFELAMEAAERKIAKRPYYPLSPKYYDRVLLRKDAIAPYLVWACLKRKHPQITPARVQELLTGDSFFVAQNAALDLFGFTAKKVIPAEPLKTAMPAGDSDSTPSPSPEASENAESHGPISNQ